MQFVNGTAENASIPIREYIFLIQKDKCMIIPGAKIFYISYRIAKIPINKYY